MSNIMTKIVQETNGKSFNTFKYSFDIVAVLRDIKVDAVFTVDPQLRNELHPSCIQVENAVSEAFMHCGIIHFPADGKVHKDAYTLKC